MLHDDRKSRVGVRLMYFRHSLDVLSTDALTGKHVTVMRVGTHKRGQWGVGSAPK